MIILVVDDEAGIRDAINQSLKRKHEVILRDNGSEALRDLEKLAIDLVITDCVMPGLTGLELIARGREISPGTAFLMMTAHGTVDQAVEAIRLGADDYFLKPFELAELEHRVEKTGQLQALRSERALLKRAASTSDLVGVSPWLQQARQFIQRAAQASSPVLLVGPSGSGKEVMTRVLHESSPVASGPFVAINCAGLTSALVESELFGHEKGAFTGATDAKPGVFELARGGTLFLDEVGELLPELQAKLLRVIQDGEFTRVGGVRRIRSNARIVAATHRRLDERVRAKQFREDLYFRLNVLSFELSPLADRPEDIQPLLDHYWKKLTRRMSRPPSLAPDTVSRLVSYPYPGNVRELQNVLERLAVLGNGAKEIGPELLPPEFQPPSARRPPVAGGDTERGLADRVAEFERELVARALQDAGQNQVQASRALRISRATLQYKMKKHGLGSEAPETVAPTKKAA